VRQGIVALGVLLQLVLASCESDEDQIIIPDGAAATTYNGEAAPDGGPSGLGKLCSADDSCKSYEASYCVVVPSLGGYCSFKNCSIEHDDCPAGYICCDYNIDGYPNACLSPAKWTEYKATLCTNAK
jgi:hypothetical protein